MQNCALLEAKGIYSVVIVVTLCTYKGPVEVLILPISMIIIIVIKINCDSK